MNTKDKDIESEIVDLLRKEKLDVAFRLLYKHYAGLIMSHCYRYITDMAVAKDILQETMIKLLESRKNIRFEHFGTLYSWLLKVSSNLCINYLNSFNIGKIITVDDDEILDNIANNVSIYDENEESLESLLDLLSGDEFNSIISQLPDGYRVVFVMYALEGFSHKEIAQKLCIKERSSSSQYHRAKIEIKRIILEWIEKRK